MKKLEAAMHGATWCIVAAFPCAALMAALWRFPVPMAGYQSGMEAVPGALFAVVFYGILGGFPLLGVLGAIGGVMVHGAKMPDEEEVRRCSRIASFSIALLATGVLAALDKLIGPW